MKPLEFGVIHLVSIVTIIEPYIAEMNSVLLTLFLLLA